MASSAVHVGADHNSLINLFLIIPIVTLAVSIIMKKKWGKFVPVLNMLTLTFASISIIAGGNGMVEYHFSIFMVIAMLSYYENVKLILISTVIFALHHLVGYFAFPELVCGTNHYPFSVLLLHAVFLILTSGSTIIQIMHRQKFYSEIDNERAEKKLQFDGILSNLELASRTVSETTNILMKNVTNSKKCSLEISETIKEIASEADQQAISTHDSSTAMNEMAIGIQRIAESSSIVAEHSQETVREARNGEASLQEITQQMNIIHLAVNSLAGTIQNLDDKSKEIGKILKVITEISE